MSAVETPALARFSMPSAASPAENAVSAPALIAAARSFSMFAVDSPVAACTFDICASKFAADTIGGP
jgi:hypothetical protein